MATAAEIQTAYKALYRADLNATVASAIAGTGISLDAYIAQQLPQVASTTQASVAIAAFITGTTPTSDKLDALTVDANKQVASYTAMGSANPQLGAFEAFGRAFATDSTTGAAFNTKYGSLSTADFISVVYAQVYGTQPNAAQLASLQGQIDYFTKLYAANNVPNGAVAAKGAVLGQIVGYAFTSSASANSLLDNQVQTVLTSAAKGDTTVYNAKLPTVTDPGQVGVTITIANATDVVGPSVADPAFKSTANNDTIQGTFVAGAKVDGGAGEDVLKVSVGAAIAPAAGELTNVETINATTTAAGGFDLTNATGVKSVGFTNGTAAGAFTNLAAGVSLFVTDTTPATAGQNATFSLKDASGSSDTASLTLNGVNGAAVVTTGYEIINLTASGENSTANGGVTFTNAGLKTLNVTATKSVALTLDSTVLESVTATGAGSVTLGALSTTTKTVDASGLTGATGVNFTVNSNSLESVKFGGGADTASITTTKFLNLDLGAGNDSLTYTQSNTTAGSALGSVTAGAGTDTLILNSTGSAAGAAVTQLVNLGAGADKVTLNDTNNVVTTLVYSGADSTLTFLDEIVNFQAAGNAATSPTKGADLIDLKAYALGAATVAYSNAALPVADTNGLFAGANIIAYNQGGTTLLIDSNKDGNFTLGTDVAIKLTGVTNTEILSLIHI